MVDVKKIPANVLAALRNREYSDDAIAGMSVREIFDEYCTWHGLIGWGDDLWSAAGALRALDPKPAEVPHIVVSMDRGLIIGAVSAIPMQISVIDYDIDDVKDDEDLREIPKADDDLVAACARVFSTEVNPARAVELIEAVEAPTIGERRSMRP